MTFSIVTLILLAVVASALIQRHNLREMATFACPYCSHAIGRNAVTHGRDCSPFEEIWVVNGESVHCRPVCRSVKCEHCGNCCTIRFNSQGEDFGPRLSAADAEQIERIKAMPPEVLSEMRTWLALRLSERAQRLKEEERA